MANERRNERVDFDTSVQLMILEPYFKVVYMKDASQNGLKIISELNLELFSELKLKNVEIENSIPFNAKVIWKRPIEVGFFAYGLEVNS